MSEFIAPRLLSSNSVDLNEGTEAKQALYTCPASRRCIITNAVFHKWSAVGDTASFRLGWNAVVSDVTQPLSLFVLAPPVNSAFNVVLFNEDAGTSFLSVGAIVGAAGEILGLKVNTPEGSALTCRVDVFGYLTDPNGVPVAGV